MELLRSTAALILVATFACGDGARAPDAGPDARVELGLDRGTDQRLDRGPPFCTTPLADGGFAKPDGCPPKPAAPDRLDEALAKLGLDRCTAIFSEQDKSLFPASLWHDPYRLPFFDAAHDHAVAAPRFARQLGEALDAAAKQPRPIASALAVAAHYAGQGGSVCLPELRPLDPIRPLASALSRLIRGAGGVADEKALDQQAAGVPLELQRALAPVLDAIAAAAADRDLALKDADLGKTATSPGVTLPTLFTYAASLTIRSKSGKAMSPTESWVQSLLQGKAKGFGYRTLYQAAIRLAATIEGARLDRFRGLPAKLEVATPLGRILVGGPGADRYQPEPGKDEAVAFLLDTGGDDEYRIPAGATVSAANPVSVLVDLGGVDSYGYPEVPSPRDGSRLPSDQDGRATPAAPGKGDGPVSLSERSRQGAGRLGIGLHFDLGLEGDRYRSLRMSQGFGALGVGVLFDAGGDDEYEAENGAQGSGVHGIGLLLDLGGKDRYRSYHQSQGFAYVQGVGVLYDASGDDSYLADLGDPAQGGDPLYFTPQLPGSGNSSFCQGAGFGRRADLGDGINMSGGLGVLRDLAGDDRYQASVFGQGTGYWFGTGLLLDAAGGDRYNGLWYVQGSDAHFALAVQLDEGGDDLYNPDVEPKATSIGVGHDFSLGIHLDLGGKDSYRAPGLSLGSGNDNGIGIFINLGGDDSYRIKGSSTLGSAPLGAELAKGARAGVVNLGVFVDAGGTDLYEIDGAPQSKNDQLWLYVPATTGTRQLGVGLDASTGSVSFP